MTSENTLLIVAEMATSGATTGVNRYLSQWLDALVNTQTRIIYLRFESTALIISCIESRNSII